MGACTCNLKIQAPLSEFKGAHRALKRREASKLTLARGAAMVGPIYSLRYEKTGLNMAYSFAPLYFSGL